MVIRSTPPRTEISFTLPALKSKAEIRKFILEKWLEEKPEVEYRYFVETFEDGSRLYLERPAQLNKGCDFVIYLENFLEFKNGNDKPPGHKDLLAEIAAKKETLDSAHWNELKADLKSVYEVRECAISRETSTAIDAAQGNLSAEKILSLAKWFFIEQDVTYWLRTGRRMLWNEICKIDN